MSKTTDALRTVGVLNDHNFFGQQVFVGYTPGDRWHSACWRVYRHGFLTNPKAHWRDHGNKTFSAFHRKDGMTARATALEEAKAWAGERYGITEWKRSPFGGYGDAEFVTKRLAELRKKGRQSV